MKKILAIFAIGLGFSGAALAETMPSFICPALRLGPVKSSSKIVGSTVVIFITNKDQRPMTALVGGLDSYPGQMLSMNFQDILGLGKNKDGRVIHAEPGQGDGTLQRFCGPKANVIIFNNRSRETYCGQCAVNPAGI